MALERRTIVDAALALLDEVGLEGLSTRALAARLGVKGPSLYWHFKNMAELRDHMAEALLATALPAPDAFPGDWPAWLADGARGIRRAALDHRDGARLLAGASPTGQHPVLNRDAMVGRLVSEGFKPKEAAGALLGLGRYALGWALYEQAGPARSASAAQAFEFGLQAMLAGLAVKVPAATRVRGTKLRPV